MFFWSALLNSHFYDERFLHNALIFNINALLISLIQTKDLCKNLEEKAASLRQLQDQAEMAISDLAISQLLIKFRRQLVGVVSFFARYSYVVNCSLIYSGRREHLR